MRRALEGPLVPVALFLLLHRRARAQIARIVAMNGTLKGPRAAADLLCSCSAGPVPRFPRALR